MRVYSLILTGALVLAVPPSSWAFTNVVDALWNDAKPVPKQDCRNFIVKAGPPRIFRGVVSGHDTVVHTIERYREGDHEEAMGWLLAGACPDKDAQETIVRNAPNVLGYLMKEYGPKVPEK